MEICKRVQMQNRAENQTSKEIEYSIKLAKIEMLNFKFEVETAQRSMYFAAQRIKELKTRIKTLKKILKKINSPQLAEAQWMDIDGNIRTYEGIIKTK